MNLPRTFRLLAPAVAPAALLFAACDLDLTGGSSGDSQPLTPATLRKAPSSVELDGRVYELTGHVWRDFMPSVPHVPPEGRGLIVLVRIREMQGRPVEADATRLWVFHEGEVWDTKFSDEARPPTPEHVRERIARDGPRWEPGKPVDLAVLLVGPSGRTRPVGVQGQLIEATF